MQIIEKQIEEIRPYGRNPRRNDAAVEPVANSIREFGFKVPIVIDKGGIIVAGHTRYKAAQRLGLDKVPCIVADDLTPEQVKAFRLADNKTAELSEWDYDLLNAEISDILDFDMGDFGFEFAEQPTHEENAEATQRRVSNILNLDKASFAGAGYYDIPEIAPVTELPPIREWIGFNFVLTDKDPEGKAVHFFIDDYQFERIWREPERYVEKLRRYAAVATPDFSPYGDMPMATQIYNHYRKHWVGRYLQDAGVTVIPTIRASTDPRSLDWYLDGEPRGGIVLISSMWAAKGSIRDQFRQEYDRMFDTLRPVKTFVYGHEIEGLRGNVEFLRTYTRERWGS